MEDFPLADLSDRGRLCEPVSWNKLASEPPDYSGQVIAFESNCLFGPPDGVYTAAAWYVESGHLNNVLLYSHVGRFSRAVVQSQMSFSGQMSSYSTLREAEPGWKHGCMTRHLKNGELSCPRIIPEAQGDGLDGLPPLPESPPDSPKLSNKASTSLMNPSSPPPQLEDTRPAPYQPFRNNRRGRTALTIWRVSGYANCILGFYVNQYVLAFFHPCISESLLARDTAFRTFETMVHRGDRETVCLAEDVDGNHIYEYMKTVATA